MAALSASEKEGKKMHRMIKLDMIHVTSCRNINSIEYMADAVFVAFWLVLLFKEGKNFMQLQVKNIIVFICYCNFQHTKLSSLF